MGEEAQVDPAVEREAASMGWIPKDKFRGDPAKWTSAEEFVRKGKEFLPILRANNAKQAAELQRVTQELTGVKTALSEASAAMETFRLYHEETAKREYERARKELVDRKKQALTDLKEGEGDPSVVVEIDEALATLDAAKPKPAEPKKKEEPKPADGGVHPDYAPWAKENESWLVDEQKAAYASAMASFIRTQNPTLVGRPFLDKVTEAVEEKFGGGSAHGKSLEGGSRNPGGRASDGGKSYADLPADAKAACDKMAQRLVGPNKMYKDEKAWRAAYCKDYDWS